MTRESAGVDNGLQNQLAEFDSQTRFQYMKKLILILSLALSSCFYQTVNNVEIEAAIIKCGNANNIIQIDSLSIGSVCIRCKDGRAYIYNNGVIR